MTESVNSEKAHFQLAEKQADPSSPQLYIPATFQEPHCSTTVCKSMHNAEKKVAC